jgi:hypothetical protein
MTDNWGPPYGIACRWPPRGTAVAELIMALAIPATLAFPVQLWHVGLDFVRFFSKLSPVG